MAKPTNRDEFTQYCLRKLGKPVHNVAVDDDQVSDRIDEAISYFVDWHMDATNRTYFKYQIQPEDPVNRYITMPENITGAIQIYPVSSLGSYGTDMFNVKYQLMLNELWTLTSINMVPYFLAMEQLSLMEELLVGMQPIRYSKYQHRLYIDADWTRITVGQYIIVEAFEIVDMTEYSEIWSDRWLQNYATAKIKEQWGENIGLYDGNLPGGIKVNYQRIIDEAQRDIEKLETEMRTTYSIPPNDFLA